MTDTTTQSAATAPNPADAGKFDPRWLAVSHKLMITEGGFVDSPNDHGGATNYGLSLRYLAQQAQLHPALIAEFDINHDGVIDLPDIKGMSQASALDVYYRFFWAPPLAASLPAPLDAAVFDQTVNDGLTPAVKMLQTALNVVGAHRPALIVDGVLGNDTRTVLNQAIYTQGAPRVLDAYRAQALGRYQAIVRRDPSQQPFLAGWTRRAMELGNV